MPRFDKTTMLIRKVRRSDLPAITDMIRELAAYHGDRATVRTADLERDLLGRRPWAIALVAKLGGALVGYAVLCPRVRVQFGRRGMDLHHLFVVQQARDKGVGRRLVEAAIEEAREAACDYMVVSAHGKNIQAQRFYEGLGFRPTSAPGPRFQLVLGVQEKA